jgi:hypothetical protein
MKCQREFGWSLQRDHEAYVRTRSKIKIERKEVMSGLRVAGKNVLSPSNENTVKFRSPRRIHFSFIHHRYDDRSPADSLAAFAGVPGRDRQRRSCTYWNFTQIEDAKDQWALGQKKTNGTVIAEMTVLNGYLKDGRLRGVMKEPCMPQAVGTPAEANLPGREPPGQYTLGGAIPAP